MFSVLYSQKKIKNLQFAHKIADCRLLIKPQRIGIASPAFIPSGLWCIFMTLLSIYTLAIYLSCSAKIWWMSRSAFVFFYVLIFLFLLSINLFRSPPYHFFIQSYFTLENLSFSFENIKFILWMIYYMSFYKLSFSLTRVSLTDSLIPSLTDNVTFVSVVRGSIWTFFMVLPHRIW